MFGNDKGFTILEVVIGSSIFLIGMLGIAALQMAAIRAEAFSGRMTEATTLARSTYEQLMAMDYDDARLNDDDNSGAAEDFDVDADMIAAKNVDANANDIPDVQENADEVEVPVGATNDNFTVYWNVCENCTLPQSKSVRIFVTWQVKGVPQTVDFVGVIPRL